MLPAVRSYVGVGLTSREAPSKPPDGQKSRVVSIEGAAEMPPHRFTIEALSGTPVLPLAAGVVMMWPL
jgi:hypothetical protein